MLPLLVAVYLWLWGSWGGDVVILHLLHHVVRAGQMIFPHLVGMILMSLGSLLQGVFDAIEGRKHSFMFGIIFGIHQRDISTRTQ